MVRIVGVAPAVRRPRIVMSTEQQRRCAPLRRSSPSGGPRTPSFLTLPSALLHPPHHALAAAALARGQRVALALEGILIGAEFDAHRGAVEAEVLPEYIGEVAP